MRYRANGIERTRLTRIAVDSLNPRRMEASRRKALAVLNEETEVLRLKDRENGLRIVRSMLEDTRERLRDSMDEVRRNAPLAALQGLFDASARRPDLSARQAETYSRYIRELVAGVGAEVKIRDVTDGVADAFARRLAAESLVAAEPSKPCVRDVHPAVIALAEAHSAPRKTGLDASRTYRPQQSMV